MGQEAAAGGVPAPEKETAMFRPRPVLVILLIGGLLATGATPALAEAPLE